MRRALPFALLTGAWAATLWAGAQSSYVAPISPPAAQSSSALVSPQGVVDQYCLSCHNQKLRTGGLSLEGMDAARPAAAPEIWEEVITRLRAGSMPPLGRPRPDRATYDRVADWLEAAIDRELPPNPGRIHAVHRLNRTEYNNAVRDLLGLTVDVRSQLPGDETADGSFDKFADSLSISTTHLERYLSVARQVTRLAVGLPPSRPTVEIVDIPLNVMQDDRQSEDLPFGSRGGAAIRHQFARGEYSVKVRLRRQYQEYLMGMGWPQKLDIRLDGRLVKRFIVGGAAKGRAAGASYAGDGEPGYAGDPEWEAYMQTGGDAGLEVRIRVDAGPHVVGVSFVREQWEPEGLPQPQQRGRVRTNDELYMGYAAVGSVHIGGPYQPLEPGTSNPAPGTQNPEPGTANPERRTPNPEPSGIFVCRPASPAEEKPCATRILSRLARLAYRRPITASDLETLLTFFVRGRQVEAAGFDEGIQFALERMLVDPDFLLRVYRDPPPGRKPEAGSLTSSYRLSDIEVASRLSFFLWSSIPDEQLLDVAARGDLTKPHVLRQQVRRMLAHPRAAAALVDDFAAQWLNLRRVDEVIVDPDRYPDFDDNLLAAFRTETEMFVASTLKEDRSVLELLSANYTFVDERLARHYRIPGIYGSRFRKVTLHGTDQRGGLLAQGALLSATSYPDRTSPVLRGKFLLNNIFGLHVPPPPPGVDTNLSAVKPGLPMPSIRERLEEHRRNPTCASCHAVIDPLGFALENFDAIGGWRTVDESGTAVDARGMTMNGVSVDGLPGLRALLLERRDQFPRTVTEKLMAYALGRRIEYYDRPAIRRIVRDAAALDHRWSALIQGIVESPAFLMRNAGEHQ